MANGEGESNHVRFFELIFQEDLRVPQTWMEKHTHRRPAGDLVQLDYVVAPVQWKNVITDVATVLGAALNSNHYPREVTGEQPATRTEDPLTSPRAEAQQQEQLDKQWQTLHRAVHTQGAPPSKAALDHSQHVGVDPATLTGP